MCGAVRGKRFGKGSATSAALYASALAAGLLDLRFTFFLILALQPGWTLFCLLWCLSEQDARAFALGGLVTSLFLFAGAVVLT